MMTANITLMTQMMDGCLILNKLGRGRVKREEAARVEVFIHSLTVAILAGSTDNSKIDQAETSLK